MSKSICIDNEAATAVADHFAFQSFKSEIAVSTGLDTLYWIGESRQKISKPKRRCFFGLSLFLTRLTFEDDMSTTSSSASLVGHGLHINSEQLVTKSTTVVIYRSEIHLISTSRNVLFLVLLFSLVALCKQIKAHIISFTRSHGINHNDEPWSAIVALREVAILLGEYSSCTIALIRLSVWILVVEQ